MKSNRMMVAAMAALAAGLSSVDTATSAFAKLQRDAYLQLTHSRRYKRRTGHAGHAQGSSPHPKVNPAGSKLVRGAYRAKHGTKASFETSRKWYAQLQ
jgi:hypothetical protein